MGIQKLIERLQAGLALDLILDALAELAATTRDIAIVVADLKRRADQQY